MTEFSPERSALRGIGASGVVFSHSLQYVFSVIVISAPLGWLIGGLENVGWMGVILFLTLSIYLLMGRLDEGVPLRKYFKSRIKRIWPTYFAYILVVIVMFNPSLLTVLWNVTFLATFMPAHSFISVQQPFVPVGLNWTLQVEEIAYLCFPLIAFLAARWRTVIAWALIGISIISVVLVMMPAHLVSYNEPWVWLSAYGAGLLAYQRKKPLSKNFKIAMLALAALPFAGFLPFGWPLGTLFVVPFAAVIVKEPPKWLRKVLLVAVGECSYTLYLIHIFFLYLFGIFGVPIAYAAAWCVEYAQRGKEMRRRLALARI